MGARFDFYHLHERSVPVDQALARLALKAYQGGKRALVKAGSGARIKALDATLWTFDPASWLPHGTREDGVSLAPEQPVYLTDEDDNPNEATFLFLLDGAWRDDVGTFERVFVLFDERDEAALQGARNHWKILKDEGAALSYWQQSPQGRWEEKVRANAPADG